MNITTATVLIILSILLFADMCVIAYILLKKWRITVVQNRRDYVYSLLSDNVVVPDKKTINTLFSNQIDKELVIYAFIELSQALQLSEQVSVMIKETYEQHQCRDNAYRKLRSVFRFNRISAAIELAHLAKNDCLGHLEKHFATEKDWLVKFYISYSLAFIHNQQSLNILIDSLINAPEWYREKVSILICKFSFDNELLAALCDRTEEEIRDLLFKMAHDVSSTRLAGFLLYHLSSENAAIAHKAASAMKHR